MNSEKLFYYSLQVGELFANANKILRLKHVVADNICMKVKSVLRLDVRTQGTPLQRMLRLQGQ